MLRILKYTLALLLLLILLNRPAVGQEAGMRVRGPRIGVDLASLALLYFDPGRMTLTFSADYEAWQDIYPVIEFGYQTVKLEKDIYQYQSNGIFGRLGVDVNLLKYEQTNVYEMFYAGFRYGMSYFTHKANDIVIPDDYFEGISDAYIVENQLNAHWISIVGGVRAELFDNLFMGWSVLANIKLAQVKDTNMVPYNIPGFGKGDRTVSMQINYTIAYRIPTQTYKPRKIIKKKEITAEPESIPLQE